MAWHPPPPSLRLLTILFSVEMSGSPNPFNISTGVADSIKSVAHTSSRAASCQRHSNRPSHQSYAVRHWMQQKGSDLIAVSRSRQAANVGAGLPRAQTECPPQSVLLCDTQMCGRRTVDPSGLGEARVEPVPPLFGTYEPSAMRVFSSPGPALTTRFEGGRNTPRGTY